MFNAEQAMYKSVEIPKNGGTNFWARQHIIDRRIPRIPGANCRLVIIALEGKAKVPAEIACNTPHSSDQAVTRLLYLVKARVARHSKCLVFESGRARSVFGALGCKLADSC